MNEEIVNLLRDAESHFVDLYRAINPHANYESEYADHRIENRMADEDSVVKAIRTALRMTA